MHLLNNSSYEVRMPVDTMSCENVERNRRRLADAHSEIYTGTVDDAMPIPMPATNHFEEWASPHGSAAENE